MDENLDDAKQVLVESQEATEVSEERNEITSQQQEDGSQLALGKDLIIFET